MYWNKKYSEETKKYFKIIKVENFLKKVKRKYQKRLLVKNILKKKYNKTQNCIKILQKKLEKKIVIICEEENFKRNIEKDHQQPKENSSCV